MSEMIACDLGASGGRVILGRLNDGGIATVELHRFANVPVFVGERLYWDILRLYHEVKQGLAEAKRRGFAPVGLGIDAWAVDFGLIGKDGELLGNPLHYRGADVRAMQDLVTRLTPERIFARTGIQIQPFNTIYQLYAMKRSNSPLLARAHRFLMIPDLLRYFLTGDMHHEWTSATTTQLFHSIDRTWDRELLRYIDVPASLFGPWLRPGDVAGQLRPSVATEVGFPTCSVYAVGEHDTASAVVAVPACKKPFAYLISGTWSLLGTEVAQPILSEKARQMNFTNEGGVGGTYRLLKNVMGLWMLQACKDLWERQGTTYTFAELAELADQSHPLASLVDPDDDAFFTPGDMPARIRAYCRRTNQYVPETANEIVRCVLESLALKYRMVLEQLENVTGHSYDGLHLVGGGVRNLRLCQWTANAIGRPVWAGPAEGSALGNLAVQWMASGQFSDVWEARGAIRASIPMNEYEPKHAHTWDAAYERFLHLRQLSSKARPHSGSRAR